MKVVEIFSDFVKKKAIKTFEEVDDQKSIRVRIPRSEMTIAPGLPLSNITRREARVMVEEVVPLRGGHIIGCEGYRDVKTFTYIVTGDVIIDVGKAGLAGESVGGSLHIKLGRIRQGVNINVGEMELGVGGSTDNIFIVLVVTGTRFTTIESGDEDIRLDELFS
jgi:hypothetical protein